MKKERGFILITLYLLLVVLLAHGSALVTRSFAEIKGAERFQQAGQSFYISEAGLDRGLQWLRTQRPPPAAALTTPFGAWAALGDGGYSVNVRLLNPGVFFGRYRIESTGSTGAAPPAVPTAQQFCAITVQRRSFSRYAYYTNNERSAVSGGLIWFGSSDRLTGPVHSNSQFNMMGTPIFDGLVTSTASSLNLAPGAAPSFNAGLQLNAPQVPMPPVADTTQAFADAAAAPGGRRFNGATTIQLVNDGTMRVTNAAAGLNGTQVVPLPANGMLYVQGGNVTVQGTLRGQLTIATDKDVRISNNVTYATDPLANPASTDLLGLVAGQNVVVNSGTPNDLRIDASIMAFGTSFRVQDYSGPLKGILTVVGGIIQENRGPVGTGNSSGVRLTGYGKNYRFDNRLSNIAPPFFPTFYETLAWEGDSN